MQKSGLGCGLRSRQEVILSCDHLTWDYKGAYWLSLPDPKFYTTEFTVV